MSDKNSKFIVLEGLEHGNVFYTNNDPNKPESEKVKSAHGDVWYKIVGYADTSKEALSKINKRISRSMFF
jgi:hypothetical protein